MLIKEKEIFRRFSEILNHKIVAQSPIILVSGS